jgi:hypothetical protein
MTGGQTPAAVLFYECIRKLNDDVDRFTFGVAFYFRFARYDRSMTTVNARLIS